MSDPHSLDELVNRWEKSRADGKSFSADDITRADGPRADLEHRLQVVASMMSFLGLCSDTTSGKSLSDASSGPRVLPEVPGYEVLEELGRGGMGVVYRARHLGLNRVVALKMVLDARHASAEELARFRSEAEAVAALQHPNIVQIFECGTHAGLPFFTLEYVPGGSLAAKVRERPLPPAESARLTEQLARGVAYAHDMGIVHRDLKPGNVLLAADETPKITDFGLAKRLGLRSAEDALTRTGSILGTPSYMAPEQASPEREVGPAVDVWALGAILYRLITGRPPFQAATPLETIRQVESAEPAAPRRLNPAVPEDLNTVCLKCLQKDPERRYASADALADDLRRFLNGEHVLARPVSRFERIWRWGRRNPALAVLSAALLLVLAASLPVMTILWQRAESQRALAVEHQGSALTAADNARYQQSVAEAESRTARA
jgi:serine/threonine protein kinase